MLNKTIKKIGLLLILLLFFILLAMLLGSLISLFLIDSKSSITIKKIVSHLMDAQSLQISFVLIAIISVFFVYYGAKLGLFGAFKLANKVERAKSNVHGQARFQTSEEMQKNFGLNEKKKLFTSYIFSELYKTNFHGIIVNSFKKNGRLYLQSVKDHHSIVVGSTGSGKSKYLMEPTIQANAVSNYKASMLIYDLKGELFRDHSKVLADQGFVVKCINLKQTSKSDQLNPLDLIWDLYHNYIKTKNIEIMAAVSAYIIDIAEVLCPVHDGENKVWTQGAQSIIVGLIWAMLEDSEEPKYQMTKDKFTFTQIGNIINRQKSDLFEYLENRPKSSKVWDYAGMIIGNESEKTVASYLATLQTAITPFLDEGIALITSQSDFSLQDIVKKPHAIFILIDDAKKARHVLCSLITTQIRNFLVYYADTKENSVLEKSFYFLLDEFANLPKVPNFNKWMSTDRGRKIFYCILLQSISQLNNIYNENEAKEILNNADLQIYLKANEVTSLEYFQKLFSQYTIYSRSVNVNQTTMDNMEYQGSTNLTQKFLVNIDELQYIQKGNVYFYFSGLPPCKSTLVPIFDPELKNNVFKIGKIDSNTLHELTDFNSRYYSILKRNQLYLNIVKTIPNDIKEITEDTFVKDDLNQVDINTLNDLLNHNLIKNEKTCDSQLNEMDIIKETEIDLNNFSSEDFLMQLKSGKFGKTIEDGGKDEIN